MIIVVENIPPRMGRLRVRAAFEKYGQVRNVQLLTNPRTRNRLAYVDMSEESEAEEAIAQLDGAVFGGTAIRVSRLVAGSENERRNIFNRGGYGGYEGGSRGGVTRVYRGGSRGAGF